MLRSNHGVLGDPSPTAAGDGPVVFYPRCSRKNATVRSSASFADFSS